MHKRPLPFPAGCYIYMHKRPLPFPAGCIYICTNDPYPSPRDAIYICTNDPYPSPRDAIYICTNNPYPSPRDAYIYAHLTYFTFACLPTYFAYCRGFRCSHQLLRASHFNRRGYSEQLHSCIPIAVSKLHKYM